MALGKRPAPASAPTAFLLARLKPPSPALGARRWGRGPLSCFSTRNACLSRIKLIMACPTRSSAQASFADRQPFPCSARPRRTIRATYMPPCPDRLPAGGRYHRTRLFRAGAPSIRHVVASPYLGCRVHRAVPPTKTDKLPSGSQWLHEIKHDGFRIIARKDGPRVRLYSRPGKDFTRRFPLIVDALSRLPRAPASCVMILELNVYQMMYQMRTIIKLKKNGVKMTDLKIAGAKAFPHVSVAPYPHAARNRNHGSVSSPRTIRSSVCTSTSQSTIITRRPFAITISIRRQPVPVPFSSCSGTIIAGTNPERSPSRPSRYTLRQANRSWLQIPCRRAVADASPGAEKLSSTIRSFSAADHRRVATRVNNFKATDVASVSKVTHTDNQLHAG